MKMSKVGNQTNSQDPQAVNSRVFVGNLNTFQCSKTDVERMFQRYGRLAGISMHKGYAFVQFTNPFDARSACLGEDGRTVLSQILDVNMVAEPKPHQTGRKRQNVAKTGNDWDYYYDSYYASTAFPVGPPRLVPPLKRQRLMAASPRTNKNNQPAKNKEIPPLEQLKIYSNPDILICGNCREMFTDLHELLDHKKTYCKLRFTCKCDTLSKNKSPIDDNSAAALLCVQCKDAFQNAWDLMVHAQAAHMLNIYELGVPSMEQCGSPPISPRDNSTPDKWIEQKVLKPFLLKTMSDLYKTSSDSDVSSDSWTLLDGGRHGSEEVAREDHQNEEDAQHSDVLQELTTREKYEIEFVSVKNVDGTVDLEELHTTPSEASLTEDESLRYEPTQATPVLEEHVEQCAIIHDYGYDNRVEKWENALARKVNRKEKRNRFDFWATMKLMGAFLSIAGLTFACVLLQRGSSAANNLVQERRYYSGHYPEVTNRNDNPAPQTSDLVFEKTSKSNNLRVPDHANVKNVLDSTHMHRHTQESTKKGDEPVEKLFTTGPITYEQSMQSIKKCMVKKLRQMDTTLSNKVNSKPSETIRVSKPSLLDELKALSTRVSKRAYSLFSQNTFDQKGETPKPSGAGNFNYGFLLKANLYLALHILNDLVLLRAAVHLKDGVKEKVKSLRRKAQVKRCRKLMRLHKMNPNMPIPRNALELSKGSNRRVEKPAKVIYSIEAKKETKQLFKELPFVNRRIPKPSADKITCTNETMEVNHSGGYFDFLQELQNIRHKRREVLKMLNLKARKDAMKEEKEGRTMDKAYLQNTYDKVITEPGLKDQMLFCLGYLHGRKRDLSALITKTDINDIFVDSPKYHQFFDRIFELEDLIVRHFRQKLCFLENEKNSTPFHLCKPNYEVAAVVDLLLARHLKLKTKVTHKDAKTGRYIVPLLSNTTLQNTCIKTINETNEILSLPTMQKSTFNFPQMNVVRIKSTGSQNDTQVKSKISALSVQNFSPSNYISEITNAEKKISSEKLEVLKTWKEKYEQLKMFWKSRQEYYDKRVEICEMIKEIMPADVKTDCPQAAQILDSMFQDATTIGDIVKKPASKELIDNVLSDIKMVFKQNESKTEDPASTASMSSFVSRSGQLYEKIFDKKAKQIQQLEERKWTTMNYVPVNAKLCSKQNLCKVFKERIQKTLP